MMAKIIRLNHMEVNQIFEVPKMSTIKGVFNIFKDVLDLGGIYGHMYSHPLVFKQGILSC
jgi:hypothetical protein